ncbi:MAG: hypothetical protein LC791_18550 [Acidobacteria bacterium]|nr:hypothetical protein [Acidobacteriota bacterium]
MTYADLLNPDLACVPEDWSLSHVREAVRHLEQYSRTWKARAHRASLKPRGRHFGERRLIAGFVAANLASAGVRLRKGSDGTVAKVLRVIYEAAGVRFPDDLFDDVADAVEQANRWTNSRKKSVD